MKNGSIKLDIHGNLDNSFENDLSKPNPHAQIEDMQDLYNILTK